MTTKSIELYQQRLERIRPPKPLTKHINPFKFKRVNCYRLWPKCNKARYLRLNFGPIGTTKVKNQIKAFLASGKQAYISPYELFKQGRHR